jgi:nucleoside-diphosphate-sugar epimerase
MRILVAGATGVLGRATLPHLKGEDVLGLTRAREKLPRIQALGAEGVETLRVSTEQVALIPQCAECEAVWLPADEEPWRAYLGGDDLDEPAEVVLNCPECAEREFAGD